MCRGMNAFQFGSSELVERTQLEDVQQRELGKSMIWRKLIVTAWKNMLGPNEYLPNVPLQRKKKFSSDIVDLNHSISNFDFNNNYKTLVNNCKTHILLNCTWLITQERLYSRQ